MKMLCTLLLLAVGAPCWAEEIPPPDAEALAAEMRQFIQEIDAPKFANALVWSEYVVMLYDRLQGRAPTPREFAVLTGLQGHVDVRPSQALSLVLRDDEPCPTYEQIRVFLHTKTTSMLAPDARARAVARDLEMVCRETEKWEQEVPEPALEDGRKDDEPFVEPDPPDVPYNVYYGFLHAHSHLSEDGSGGPLEAYEFARDTGKLDFFALTDHGEFLALWPWTNDWQQLCDAADATNDPGRYVALHGFEWSNPILGHINVINSEDFTGAVRTFSIPSIYRWVQERPDSFARFNHPGDYNLTGQEFSYFRLFPGMVDQMVGLELWNRSVSFDFYHYLGSWDSPYGYLDNGNRKGWRLGALGAQDNHDGVWGTRNDFRTAVLAEELTREAILDAYRHRRFYSTEDKDLVLDFRCNGYPMGSRVQGMPRVFTVTASDGSGDRFEEVRFYRNGDLLKTLAVQNKTLNITFEDGPALTDDYYYVIVRQTDDNNRNGRNDEAISSPIWVGPPTVREAGCGGWYWGNTETKAAGVLGDGVIALVALVALWLAGTLALPFVHRNRES